MIELAPADQIRDLAERVAALEERHDPRSVPEIERAIADLLTSQGAKRVTVERDDGPVVKIIATATDGDYAFWPAGRGKEHLRDLLSWLESNERAPVGFWRACLSCRRESWFDRAARWFGRRTEQPTVAAVPSQPAEGLDQ